MKEIDLYLKIILPILSVISTIFIILLVMRFSDKSESSFKGKKFFKLNLHGRKLMLLDNGNDLKTIFRITKPNTWFDMKKFTKQIAMSDSDNKILRDAIEEISTKRINKEVFFQSRLVGKKKTLYDFQLSFNPIAEDSDYFMTISWKIAKNVVEQKSKISFIKKEDITNNKSLNKGFIGFNLNSQVMNAEENLLNILQKYSKRKSMEFFAYKNNHLLILIIFNNKKIGIKRTISYITNSLKNTGKDFEANMYFKGSSYIINNNVYDNKNLLRVFKGLDFFTMMSISESIPFFSSDKMNEYPVDLKTYTNALSTFKNSLKSQNILSKKVPIKNIVTNRKVVNYAYPTIPGLDDKIMDQILINKNNKFDLINNHAIEIGINSKADEPVLVDVYSDWLIENYKALKFMNVVYVINISHETKFDDIRPVLHDIKNRGFVFALRIKYFSEIILSLIKTTKPKFLLIDKYIWSQGDIFSTDSYVQLLSLNHTISGKDIKLIYENPPIDIIDNNMSQKIGLKFYFNV